MVATSVGIPYEVYDLAAKVTALRLAAFVVNLALVLYLVLTKRLFGVRGGKQAYDARLRSESIIDSELAALDELAAGRHGARLRRRARPRRAARRWPGAGRRPTRRRRRQTRRTEAPGPGLPSG